MIEIAKVTGGYVGRATPPHVTVEWQTGKPMSASALIAELRALGAHQTDLGDAFYLANPDWLGDLG